jgi:hypothetical protein
MNIETDSIALLEGDDDLPVLIFVGVICVAAGVCGRFDLEQ